MKAMERQIQKSKEVYVCPDCGEPFTNVSAVESHVEGVYEVRLMAWH